MNTKWLQASSQRFEQHQNHWDPGQNMDGNRSRTSNPPDPNKRSHQSRSPGAAHKRCGEPLVPVPC